MPCILKCTDSHVQSSKVLKLQRTLHTHTANKLCKERVPFPHLPASSSPAEPAPEERESGMIVACPQVSQRGMSHSPTGDEWSGTHYDSQAL